MDYSSEPRADKAVFSSPFSKGYLKSALSEIKKPRMLVFAAMIIAVRVALKSVTIPIIPGTLYISVGFFANALGSMVYGPFVGLISGAISDTIGAFLFPTGDYFFPFIITEMLSSFIFGLFLYRSKLTAGRIIISRFTVVTVCNLILTPIIMRWYYAYFGIEKSYKLFTVARLLKNGALFPLESLLLILFLRALLPVTERMKITYCGEKKITLSRKNIIALVLLTVVAAVIIYFYVEFYVMKR